MPSIESLSLFFTASLLLAIAPGPDNLFVLTLSALRGPARGMMVVLGLCSGLLVHTAAVAVGVAALIQSSAVAFTVLKFIGAAYLFYLGWQALRAPAAHIDALHDKAAQWGVLYRRGIVMNVTNPKVSIFFLAFLPQFADPARGPLWMQIVLLGVLFIVAALLVFGVIALVAGALGRWFARSPGALRWMNRLAGVVLIGLALRLALLTR